MQVMKNLVFLTLLGTIITHSCNANDVQIKKFTDAAYTNNIDTVTKLLNQNKKIIDGQGPGGQTALQRAASQAHAAIVALLLNEDANPNIADAQQVTPLIAAIMSYPKIKKERGESSALHAVNNIIELLIYNEADVNAQDILGQTALKLATANELSTVIKMLVDALLVAQIKEFTDAAYTDNIDTVTTLLSEDIDINSKGPGGQTALQRAASQAHADMVRLLLNKDANPNIADAQQITPLIAALMSYYSAKAENKLGPEKALQAVENMVSSLIQKGANINVQDAGGLTALIRATGIGLTTVVEILLDAGAGVELKTSFGEPKRAIDFAKPKGEIYNLLLDRENQIKKFTDAAYTDNIDTVTTLLNQNKKIINSKDPDGQTALQKAAGQENTEVVKYLLENGADPNISDTNKSTPLMEAIEPPYTRLPGFFHARNLKAVENIVKLLIVSGAEINLQNTEGQTALKLALDSGLNTVVKILRNAEKEGLRKKSELEQERKEQEERKRKEEARRQEDLRLKQELIIREQERLRKKAEALDSEKERFHKIEEERQKILRLQQLRKKDKEEERLRKELEEQISSEKERLRIENKKELERKVQEERKRKEQETLRLKQEQKAEVLARKEERLRKKEEKLRREAEQITREKERLRKKEEESQKEALRLKNAQEEKAIREQEKMRKKEEQEVLHLKQEKLRKEALHIKKEQEALRLKQEQDEKERKRKEQEEQFTRKQEKLHKETKALAREQERVRKETEALARKRERLNKAEEKERKRKEQEAEELVRERKRLRREAEQVTREKERLRKKAEASRREVLRLKKAQEEKAILEQERLRKEQEERRRKEEAQRREAEALARERERLRKEAEALRFKQEQEEARLKNPLKLRLNNLAKTLEHLQEQLRS